MASAIASEALTGCEHSASGSVDGRLTVVTSFYPLEAIARAVGDRTVEVTDLTPPGVEPHDLELSSDQLDAILDADVVLYLGGGFQPAVEDAVEQRDPGQVTVDVLAALGSAVRAPGPGVAEGQETSDPHVWLDPRLMDRVVDVVAQALTRGDHVDRAAFRAAAVRAHTKVRRLAEDYRTGLANCRSNVIVTTHAAFGYLAKDYGLRQEPLTGLSPEGEPDPAHLAAIEDIIRRDHVTTVFTEPLVPPAVADTIARETHTRVDVLDPLESLTPTGRASGEDYFSIMRKNLDALREALGCTG